MAAIRKQPVNCALILLCIVVWNMLRTRRWGWEEVGSSYRNVVLEGNVIAPWLMTLEPPFASLGASA